MNGSIVIGVRGWLLWTSCAGILAMGIGSYLALRRPRPSGPCLDFVDHMPAEPGAACSAGGCTHPDHSFEWVSDSHGSGAYFRCVCRHPPTSENR